MRIFENYGSYWPVLVPAVCFLLLGLWLWLVSERAMEAAPKQLRWISEYRRPGFPFRAERMPFPPLRWPAVVAVALIAAAWQGLILLNTGFAIFHSWTALNPTRYTWMLMLVAALGTAAVYVLLQLLYESGFSAFLGALLFAISPTDSQGPTCLLAIAGRSAPCGGEARLPCGAPLSRRDPRALSGSVRLRADGLADPGADRRSSL